MNEDEFFAFDDNIRKKRFRLFRRDVYFRHLEVGQLVKSYNLMDVFENPDEFWKGG